MYRRHRDFDADLLRAANPRTPSETLASLVDKHHGDLEIAEAVAANPSCPADLYRDMCKFGMAKALENPRRKELLGSTRRDWEDFWRYKSGDTGVRLLFGMFDPLLDKERPEAWRLGRLLDYASPKALRDIAAIETIPESVVRLLAADASAATRRIVAKRRGVPLDVFEELARDSAKTVRHAVAENPSAPPGVIEHLTGDKDAAIREAACRHAACPADIAGEFADTEQALREEKIGRLDELERYELLALALDLQTPPSALAELAEYDDPVVRFTAGYHGRCPVEALSRLARDPVAWVRAAVAFSLAATPDVLAELDRGDRDIQIGLASRPDYDEAQQIALVGEVGDAALRSLANLTPYPEVWFAIERRLRAAKKAAREEIGWHKLFINTMAKAREGNAPKNPKIATIEQLFTMRIYARLAPGPLELLSLCAHYLPDDYAANPLVVRHREDGDDLVKPKAFARWKIDEWMGTTEVCAPGVLTNFYATMTPEDAYCQNEPHYVACYSRYARFNPGNDATPEGYRKRHRQAARHASTEILFALPMTYSKDEYVRRHLMHRDDLLTAQYAILAGDADGKVSRPARAHLTSRGVEF